MIDGHGPGFYNVVSYSKDFDFSLLFGKDTRVDTQSVGQSTLSWTHINASDDHYDLRKRKIIIKNNRFMVQEVTPNIILELIFLLLGLAVLIYAADIWLDGALINGSPYVFENNFRDDAPEIVFILADALPWALGGSFTVFAILALMMRTRGAVIDKNLDACWLGSIKIKNNNRAEKQKFYAKLSKIRGVQRVKDFWKKSGGRQIEDYQINVVFNNNVRIRLLQEVSLASADKNMHQLAEFLDVPILEAPATENSES